MSLPLKMMYSKMSSRGRMGLSVGRSSVPKDRTEAGGQTQSGHYRFASPARHLPVTSLRATTDE